MTYWPGTNIHKSMNNAFTAHLRAESSVASIAAGKSADASTSAAKANQRVETAIAMVAKELGRKSTRAGKRVANLDRQRARR